ncbi:hypothetical protein [Raoultella lignicola]|uniref:Uncharacterized protein n=1 Tax=Raoultella lignicola TaxID=3040939 RepID=A0ABU9F1D9_9ENTR
MTSKLTRERIGQYANDPRMCNINDEIREMARMALAAMDSEPNRNPVLAYADSYRDMAKQGVESVPIWSVITDLERNIAPLYRHAQPAVDSDFIPKNLDKALGVLGMAIPESREEFNFQTERWIQRLIDRVIRYADEFQAQPAPVVPEGLNPETTDLVLRFASALADQLYKAEQKYGRSTDWMKDDWYDDCLQSLWEHIEKGDPRDVAAYCAFMWYHGWVTTDYDRNVQNACRAAMLNHPSSIQPNTGAAPGAEIKHPSTNSPAIPEGYVMVPKEPTAEILAVISEAIRTMRGSAATYARVLAATPQEVK